MDSEELILANVVRNIAGQMVVAAITAPKARGINNMKAAILDKEMIKNVSDHILVMAREKGLPSYFERDAHNIMKATQLVIIGTRIKSSGVQACGLCGYPDCNEKDKHPEHPCSFNTGDLGIAIGSAVSLASDHRVDNRIMYTVGKAVVDMKLLGKDVKIAYGIPLSVSSKNPFFDRTSI